MKSKWELIDVKWKKGKRHYLLENEKGDKKETTSLNVAVKLVGKF